MQKEDARPAIDSLVCACVRNNTSHTVWAKVLCYAQKSAEVVCSAERERVLWYAGEGRMVYQHCNKAMPAL